VPRAICILPELCPKFCGEETLFESSSLPGKWHKSERPPLMLVSHLPLFSCCLDLTHFVWTRSIVILIRAEQARGEYLKKPLTRHAGPFFSPPSNNLFQAPCAHHRCSINMAKRKEALDRTGSVRLRCRDVRCPSHFNRYRKFLFFLSIALMMMMMFAHQGAGCAPSL
jgi:hypothetical protein